MHVRAHKCLRKVLSNLKEVISKYPSLESKEILEAAGQLITKVKSHNYDESDISDDFYQSIDKLALVFSSRLEKMTFHAFIVINSWIGFHSILIQ